MTYRILMMVTMIVIPVFIKICIYLNMRYSRRRVGSASIKYSIDNLPIGLMFYGTDGLVFFANWVIDRFCETVTGEPLMNGNRFHEALYEGRSVHGVRLRGGEDAFALQVDDRVLEFQRTRVEVAGTSIYQLTYVDITEYYEQEKDLKRQVQVLEEAHERLKEFAQNIKTLAADEARLGAKVRIHDMIGQELLASRHYLTEPGASVTGAKLIERWILVLEDLKASGEGQGLVKASDTAKQNAEALQGLVKAAEAIGLNLHFEGELPEVSMRTVRIIMSVARVCMTNAVRHGDAKNMIIRFELLEEEDILEVRYANDGLVPPQDIKLGGGLQSIRKLMDEVKGEVYYERDTEFAIVISVSWRGL